MRSLKFALAAMAATMALGTAQAEPVKIRMAWVAPVSNWASIVLEKKDLAKHLGKSYTLETVRFAGTPPMMTALAAGELEIANLAYSTFPLAVQNANMDDLRVIADEFQDGVTGFATNEWAVLKDSPIQKTEDLKGKIIATNAAGSAVDIAARESGGLVGLFGVVRNHARHARLDLGIKERVVKIVGTLGAGIVNNDLRRDRCANRVLSGHRQPEMSDCLSEICHDAPGELLSRKAGAPERGLAVTDGDNGSGQRQARSNGEVGRQQECFHQHRALRGWLPWQRPAESFVPKFLVNAR